MERNTSALRMAVVHGFLQMKGQIDYYVQPLLQQYGLSRAGLLVLFHIAYQEKCPTMGELYRAMHLNQGNASSLCKRLERDGYLTRQRKKEDERVVELMLTAKGDQILAEIEADLNRMDQALLLHSDAELQAALDGLNTFVRFVSTLQDEVVGLKTAGQET